MSIYEFIERYLPIYQGMDYNVGYLSDSNNF